MNDSSAETTEELIALSRKLLDAIDAGDWQTYSELCDPSLSAFEPEAVGQLVRGMDFHRFYFDPSQPTEKSQQQSSICSPDVRLMGDVAIVAYVRLTQRQTADGGTSTSANEETRIWQRRQGRWRHVHFHRSRSGEIKL